MIKSYVFIYLLFTFHMITKVSCDSAEVIWDDSRDLIYYEGKLYFPSNDKNAPLINNNYNNKDLGKDINSDSDKNLNNEVKNKLDENNHAGHEAHEEELASGAQFWFCVFMILCKIL